MKTCVCSYFHVANNMNKTYSQQHCMGVCVCLSAALWQCPIPHFSIQKGARKRPLCGRYAPSIRTSAGHAQTSTWQSKRHYITKVQTQRKTARGCHLGQGQSGSWFTISDWVQKRTEIERKYEVWRSQAKKLQLSLDENSCFHRKTEMFGNIKTLNMRLRQCMLYFCFSSHLQVKIKYMNNTVLMT